MSDRDLERFDRWSASYDRHFTQWLLFRRVHTAMLAALDADPHAVLDVGCGTGALLRRIRDRWPSADLAGLDAAPGMAAEAQRLCQGCDIRHGFAESLPWADGSFDLVVTSVSFHHWRDKAAGIREAARVLRPGGRFMLADVGGDGLAAWAGGIFGRLAGSHEEFLPSAAIAERMRAAGLREVRLRPLLGGHFRLITSMRA